MNEASVYLLKQNNGTKEIFSNNFFLSTFESYHPLRENDLYPVEKSFPVIHKVGQIWHS